MCLSTIVSRRIYVKNSTRKYYPNMYIILLADSGGGKEVAIIDLAGDIIKDINPDLILPSNFTPESLIKELGDRSETMRPQGTVFQDELTKILSSKKFMAEMTDTLTELYNTNSAFVKVLVKYEEPIRIPLPYLGLYLGTQPDRLPYLFQSVDISGGFIPRSCVFGWEISPPQHKEEDAAFRELAVKSLKQLNDALPSDGSEIKVDIARDAVDMVFAEQNRLKHDIVDDRVRGCYARALDPLFKVSLLYWLNEATNDDVVLSEDEEVGKGEKQSSTSSTSSTCYTSSHNSTEYIYLSKSYINNLSISNFPKLSNLSNDVLARYPVTPFHVAKCISLYRLTLPWVQKLAESASSSVEEKNIIVLGNTCRSLALRGYAKEIPNGNGGVVFAIERSDILRHSRMNTTSLSKYLDTLVGRGEVLGQPIVYSEKGAGKKCTYYPILRHKEA
jgi:hypothetical protein